MKSRLLFYGIETYVALCDNVADSSDNNAAFSVENAAHSDRFSSILGGGMAPRLSKGTFASREGGCRVF